MKEVDVTACGSAVNSSFASTKGLGVFLPSPQPHLPANITDTLGYRFVCHLTLHVCSYQHFDVNCDLLLNRRTATSKVFVSYFEIPGTGRAGKERDNR